MLESLVPKKQRCLVENIFLARKIVVFKKIIFVLAAEIDVFHQNIFTLECSNITIISATKLDVFDDKNLLARN